MNAHLVLVGLMGAGKTTVGRVCAERLDRPFVDTDDVVTAMVGRPVPELIATDGLDRFRELESQAVADVCASPVPLVVACGGGTILDPDNRRRLHEVGFVVWLQAPVPVLVARVGDGSDRPLLAGDPVGALQRLGALREPLYEAVAHCAVDTSDRDVSAVADAVLDAYARVRA